MRTTLLLFVSAASLMVLLSGCSGKEANPESAPATAPPAASATPTFDFGKAKLAPDNGSGMEATLRITLSGGTQKPALIGMLIKDRQNGSNACYPFHNLTNGARSLVTDAGAGVTLIDGARSTANSQCQLLADGTQVIQDTNGITAVYHVRFLPSFKGLKHIWVAPEDGIGNGPEMQMVGDWTVK